MWQELFKFETELITELDSNQTTCRKEEHLIDNSMSNLVSIFMIVIRL